MIGTIGSLVQETPYSGRWIIATCIYTVACLSTSSLLGACLGTLGLLIRNIPFAHASVSTIGLLLVGFLSVAYACSDVGLMRLPRPCITQAVPVTWWRWWRPYGAALAYGAALGFGVTTHIQFGAFYVLCVWCVQKGNTAYGAVLIGIYGIVRALMIIPTSRDVYSRDQNSGDRLICYLSYLENFKFVVAVVLALFGALVIGSLWWL